MKNHKEEVDFIENSQLYATTSSNLVVANDEKRRKIYITAKYLFDSAFSLYKLSEKIIDKLSDNSISIKLRDTQNYNLFLSDINNLYKCISQLILNQIVNGKLEIESLESGSKWINICLGTHLAVSIVASAAWSGAVVYKKIQEGRIFSEYAKGLSIKNESIEEFANKLNEAVSALVNEEAKRIQVKFYNDDEDNENFERIKYSIKLFSELIENGTEIHPSLTAPESVQNLFPDFKNLEAIVSQKKLITDKKASN